VYVEIDQARGEPQSRKVDSTRVIRSCVTRLELSRDPAAIEQQVGSPRLARLRIEQHPSYQQRSRHRAHGSGIAGRGHSSRPNGAPMTRRGEAVSDATPDIDEDLKILETKLNQLKREYEQYFLGTRPREPVLVAGEVRKIIARLSNTAIQNTGLKFKFSSICSRYQALNRQWQETLRKIDQGTYERHRFKAKLHGSGARAPNTSDAPPETKGSKLDDPSIYDAYVEARQACGQGVAKLSPAKLQAVLRKQEQSLRKRFGDTDVRFRVVVENGKAKLKASRAGD
jgi:hypothetical protein